MKWGDKQAMIQANVTPPTESAHEGPSPDAEELIQKLNRMAANMRRGMSPQQVRDMEARSLAAFNGAEPPIVETEVVPPPQPHQPTTAQELARENLKVRPHAVTLDNEALDLRANEPSKRKSSEPPPEPEPAPEKKEFYGLRCTSVKPEPRQTYPHVITSRPPWRP